MEHLTNGELYRIAKLLSQGEAFEQEDMLLLHHSLRCSECSARLKRSIAIVDSVDHIAEVHMLTKKTDASEASNSAIIQIVVLDAKAILKQLQSDTAQWLFEAPLRIGGKRSAGDKEAVIESIEDRDNSKTFVSYNAKKNLLTIQIDGAGRGVPKAKIKEKNGALRSISFEKCGSVYRAELNIPEQGSYELILER